MPPLAKQRDPLLCVVEQGVPLRPSGGQWVSLGLSVRSGMLGTTTGRQRWTTILMWLGS